MKLTTLEEYGLRCLVQLGRGDGGSLTIAEMSQAEGISAPNVAKIMRVLRRAGLVTSTRGQSGGYTLARDPSAIPVSDVLAALGGRFYDSTFCDKHKGVGRLCTHLPDCSIRPVLRQVQEAVDQVLSTLTLKSLLVSEEEVRVAVSPRAIALPILPS
jgi:Rrf2 family transcriptional regulator, iron-sulfur cluster assembly transcription factor